MDCEAEVRDLGDAVVHEDVGNLQVAMNNPLRGEIAETAEDVGGDAPDLSLLETLPAPPEERLEIALVAELSNQIAVAVAAEDFEAAQHVGVVELPEDLDLGVQQFFKPPTLE